MKQSVCLHFMHILLVFNFAINLAQNHLKLFMSKLNHPYLEPNVDDNQIVQEENVKSLLQ